MTSNRRYDGLEIAIIGMSAAFPGSSNYSEYWQHLKEGKEMIKTFSDEELRLRGVSEKEIKDTLYVKSEGILDDKDCFDAFFFGYRSEEATLMDPQVRLFHQHCWSALEDAGYSSYTDKIKIGLFAGASSNDNWKAYVYGKAADSAIEPFYLNFLMSHNFISSFVSYKLNLRGPAFFVDTACSTSLVAVHLACRSLLTRDCKIALAGGVSLKSMKRKGYIYQEGMVSSKDGKVRTFDKDATGAVGGEGTGVVVLKRLNEAIQDGDNIYAIIRSTAINNDGSQKVGYTAPGIKGQVDCIVSAQKMAGVDPRSITYIETHGTATKLGDSIEIQALNEAFGITDNHKFCAIGSVKTNIGHLDVAAGVAGLIKTVLSLKHRQIPPSLHFKEPNKEIDFTNGPFYVNTALKKWESSEPLRAGVSAFGVGGANAHLILEEAPEREPSTQTREFQLLLLSARTADSLEKMTSNLAVFLKENKNYNLADICYSLQVGRKEFPHRRKIVCGNIDQAIDALCDAENRNVKTNKVNGESHPVVFMFSGLGAQYFGMCKGLYESEPLFKATLDICFELVLNLTGTDIKKILFPDDQAAIDHRLCHQIDTAQYIVFITEYALAKLLIAWGIKPAAMIGYSFGEYVAACLSGVFTLEDALKIICKRAALIQKTPPAAMLSVPLEREQLLPLLNNNLSLSIDNGQSCVVSGPIDVVSALERKMTDKRLMCVRLDSQYAIHSHMMDAALPELKDYINTITLHAPQIPYISNVTGNWISPQDATNPAYWTAHLRNTVQFAMGIDKLLTNNKYVYIEIGPGSDISTLMNRALETKGISEKAINLVRSANNPIADNKYLLNRIGQLWLYGISPDWDVYYEKEKRFRVALPSYSFEHTRYDAEVDPFQGATFNSFQKGNNRQIKDCLYLPTWKRGLCANKSAHLKKLMPVVLLFADNCGVAGQMMANIDGGSSTVIVVYAGDKYAKLDNFAYQIHPENYSDYESLFADLKIRNCIPDQIIHLFSITNSANYDLQPDSVRISLSNGYYSLINITQALAALNTEKNIQLYVMGNGILEVSGVEAICPDKTTVLGPVKIIPQEFFNIQCRYIDLDLPLNGDIKPVIIYQLLNEIEKNSCNNEISALRGDYMWLPVCDNKSFDEVHGNTLRLKENGVYLITGGLGGIALRVAVFLAMEVKAKLILVSRSSLPPKNEWQNWLLTHDNNDSISEKILQLEEVEKHGGQALVLSADISDKAALQSVIESAQSTFGVINGVIHTATVADGSLLAVREKQLSEDIFKSKLYGTIILDEIIQHASLDFVVYFSALTSLIGGFGQVGYCAANIFLDSFARYKSKKCNTYVVSINWSRWQGTGIARIAEKKHLELTKESLQGGMEVSDALECFKKILSYGGVSQVAVAEFDLPAAMEQMHGLREIDADLQTIEDKKQTNIQERKFPRLDLSCEYIAPENETEAKLAQIWEDYFGLEKVGIDDNFFELGGDSLKGMILLKRINELFDTKLSLRDILMNATVRMIATKIDELIWINKTSEKKFTAVI